MPCSLGQKLEWACNLLQNPFFWQSPRNSVAFSSIGKVPWVSEWVIAQAMCLLLILPESREPSSFFLLPPSFPSGTSDWAGGCGTRSPWPHVVVVQERLVDVRSTAPLSMWAFCDCDEWAWLLLLFLFLLSLAFWQSQKAFLYRSVA